VVIAINMMDIVRKNGDVINIEALSKSLGCEIVEISALKGTGITEVAEKAIEALQEIAAAFDDAAKLLMQRIYPQLSEKTRKKIGAGL
jgi:ferrous iron transport protein B